MNKSIVHLILLIVLVASCSENANTITSKESKPAVENENAVIVDKEQPERAEIVDSNIIAFIDQFKFNFPDTVDFGWRFIESNYDTSAVETKGIKYNEDYFLNNIHFFNINGEPLGKSIEGYAHSCKRLNEDSLAFLTLVNGEISQGINLYITNNDLNVLSKYMVASNGGDEGSWFYKFGAFDSTYSYFASEEVAGFALDTNEQILDTLWISPR